MNARVSLPDGSSWPPPLDEETGYKLNCFDSEAVTLTRAEAWRLRSIVGAYDHLVSHPAGTEAALRKLRMLRRALAAEGARTGPPVDQTERSGLVQLRLVDDPASGSGMVAVGPADGSTEVFRD